MDMSPMVSVGVDLVVTMNLNPLGDGMGIIIETAKEILLNLSGSPVFKQTHCTFTFSPAPRIDHPTSFSKSFVCSYNSLLHKIKTSPLSRPFVSVFPSPQLQSF